jgi:hypothetical protein
MRSCEASLAAARVWVFAFRMMRIILNFGAVSTVSQPGGYCQSIKPANNQRPIV